MTTQTGMDGVIREENSLPGSGITGQVLTEHLLNVLSLI